MKSRALTRAITLALLSLPVYAEGYKDDHLRGYGSPNLYYSRESIQQRQLVDQLREMNRLERERHSSNSGYTLAPETEQRIRQNDIHEELEEDN